MICTPSHVRLLKKGLNMGYRVVHWAHRWRVGTAGRRKHTSLKGAPLLTRAVEGPRALMPEQEEGRGGKALPGQGVNALVEEPWGGSGERAREEEEEERGVYTPPA